MGAPPERFSTMSAPPEQRGGAPRPNGAVAWPITTDRRPTGPRPDLLAALITVIAGALGVSQLFLSWTSIVSGVGLQDANGGVTGWERFLAARAGASLSVGDFATTYSVVGTALAGAALVLLGLAMFLPIDHRPLGAVALVLSIAATAGALWWLIRGHHTFNQTVGDLFAHAGPGWYLFLVAGPIGIVGSARALSRG